MRKRLFLLLPVLLLCVVGAYAQNTVRGIVTSATDQEPIIGASVVEKGSTNGTVTDMDGRFQLSVKANAKLVISYIGYETKEITPTGSAEIKIALAEDNNLLDDFLLADNDPAAVFQDFLLQIDKRLRLHGIASPLVISGNDMNLNGFASAL